MVALLLRPCVSEAIRLLAAAAARRARLDALRDIRGIDKSAGQLIRGNGGCAPHGGAAVALAPRSTRGAAVRTNLGSPARPVGMSLDWSIISAWGNAYLPWNADYYVDN